MSTVRIQQILARAGVASRRRAETLMTAGRVAVNGQVVKTLGAKAHPNKDHITVDGKPIGAAQPAATIMLHKPVQVMTTLDDPEGRETVADIIQDESLRFVPVGRLDFQTEGLLLMTTDGELMNRLLHPRHHVPKVYQVKVRGRVQKSALDQLRDGVKLEDGMTRPSVVEVIHQGDTHTWLEIVVTEGRNRLVRRMVDVIGHPALRVVRTEMATLELGDLKPAQYRYLNGTELSALYMTAGLSAPKVSERAEETGFQWLGKARRGRGPLPLQDGVSLKSTRLSTSKTRKAPASRGRSDGSAGRAGHGGTDPDVSHPRGRNAPRGQEREVRGKHGAGGRMAQGRFARGQGGREETGRGAFENSRGRRIGPGGRGRTGGRASPPSGGGRRSKPR